MSGVLARGSKHYARVNTVTARLLRCTNPRSLEREGVEARLEGICEYLEN
jgi:hypothetical protein